VSQGSSDSSSIVSNIRWVWLNEQARLNGLQLGITAAMAFSERGHVHLVALDHTHNEWQTVHVWCADLFGEGGYSYADGKGGYSYAGHVFGFLSEQDALMFKLRWG
jgi:hypothetical protein